MEVVIGIIVLLGVIWFFYGNKEVKQTKIPTRIIKKVGIFDRYEVTSQGYYGLRGLTKREVDVCIGTATFDSCHILINGAGIKEPSERNYKKTVVPSNYKLIKSNFIKEQDE